MGMQYSNDSETVIKRSTVPLSDYMRNSSNSVILVIGLVASVATQLSTGSTVSGSSSNSPSISRVWLIEMINQLLKNLARMQQFGTLVQKISVTPKEEEIFNTFLGFVKEKQLNTTLRVAGGWVRDKVQLLGLESHDIDIALDNMMGAEFVKLMNDYLVAQTGEKAHGFGVTKFNPDKSKHLETACVRIKDVWIDVVNLRGETYTETSRIPQMTIGSPTQDAERRDLTINALYYNLHDGQVEDFTGRGLSDLANGIIRTPLDPTRTFLDDPLRILRTFRFAARFKFAIDAAIFESLKNRDIKEQLRVKVSRERVGIELTAMLQHSNVFAALQQFFDNQLWDVVFDVPAGSDITDRDRLNRESFLMTTYLSQSPQLPKIQGDTKTISMLAYLGCICYPFARFHYKQGKSTNSVASFIMLESLKLPKKETQTVLQLIDSAIKLDSLKRQNLEDRFDDVVGWVQEAGALWELSVLLQHCNEQLQDPKCIYPSQFVQFIYDHGLQTFYDEKPLINGGDISKIKGLQPGPAIKQALSQVLLWQARHRSGTKEELIEFLKNVN